MFWLIVIGFFALLVLLGLWVSYGKKKVRQELLAQGLIFERDKAFYTHSEYLTVRKSTREEITEVMKKIDYRINFYPYSGKPAAGQLSAKFNEYGFHFIMRSADPDMNPVFQAELAEMVESFDHDPEKTTYRFRITSYKSVQEVNENVHSNLPVDPLSMNILLTKIERAFYEYDNAAQVNVKA